MGIYLVWDYDHNLMAVYDEETFKTAYKQYEYNPPLYSNTNYWQDCSVTKWTVNTEESVYVSVDDMRKLA